MRDSSPPCWHAPRKAARRGRTRAPVDRVLPDVPVRQYVLSLPYELRRLAAFKADVLTALGRIFVEADLRELPRARQARRGIEDGQCGAINFVQRFGSLNLNVHFHVVVLDGVFTRDPDAGVLFHPASPPTREELEAIVRRVRDRALAWLRRHGYLDERPIDERSNEPPAQTALDACAAIAMGRGQVATLPNADAPAHEPTTSRRPTSRRSRVERDGFNLHAGVRIEAGDDLGRERLMRYGARPPLSLERLRRLPGGRVAYRLKYVSRGRGKHRVMTAMEFMARLAALDRAPTLPACPLRGRARAAQRLAQGRRARAARASARVRRLPRAGVRCTGRASATRRAEAAARPAQRRPIETGRRHRDGGPQLGRARPASVRRPRRRHRARAERALGAPLGSAPRAARSTPPRRESTGPACSGAPSTAERTAVCADDVTVAVRITHPFHPQFGQELGLVTRRANWGEDRVFYRCADGHVASLPARWTSLVADDPVVVMSNGRTPFRVDDLIELAALVSRLRG